jgi:anti-sigma B factor antagonist
MIEKEQAMDCRIDDEDGVRIVRLVGPLDVSQALALRELLGDEISAAARVLVDLSEVPLIDSSGIGVMVSAHRRADGAGAAFALAGAGPTVARVFSLTRTDRLLRLYESVPEGVAALRAA